MGAAGYYCAIDVVAAVSSLIAATPNVPNLCKHLLVSTSIAYASTISAQYLNRPSQQGAAKCQSLTSEQPPSLSGRKASTAGVVARSL